MILIIYHEPVGGQPLPAKPGNARGQHAWDVRHGRRYYRFLYKNESFLVLDTEDASPERAQQLFEIRNAGIRHGRDYIRLATTGGSQFTDTERSMDHVMLVTVDDVGVDIANLLLDGILDKTGHVPLGGDEVCFELARCSPGKGDNAR